MFQLRFLQVRISGVHRNTQEKSTFLLLLEYKAVLFKAAIKTLKLTQTRAPEASGFDSGVSESDVEYSTNESMNLPHNDCRIKNITLILSILLHSENRCINCLC